jgi:hypothetical protein
MTPRDFSFKVTLPADPEGATIVAVLAGHAVDYVGFDGVVSKAFVERARAAALKALNAMHGAGPRQGCLAVVAAANGQLTVTIGSESVSQPLPA